MQGITNYEYVLVEARHIYREDFYSLGEFRATGAPPAAKYMQILPMNQHA
jgi:hypothetical protein